MKKVGIIIFIAALIIGLMFAKAFSTGKPTSSFFSISINRSVTGSGNASSEKRDVTDFQAIEVGGIFDVEVVAQKDFSVEIEADDNLLPLIETEVSNGTLRIGSEQKIFSKNIARVRISAPNIKHFDISGASKISLVNLKNESLQIDSSGTSKITVAGETENLTINVSGTSKIEAENLKTENASVNSSGASKVCVYAVNELKSDASGASSVIYSGNPKNLIRKTSGVSSIKEK